MRIAQISPLFEAVPPKLYGGTERVVYALTEELVAMGHDVTLFASGDSITSATLAPMRNKALRLDPSVVDWIAIYMRMMELIRRRAHEFDVLHFHTDYFPLSLFSRQDTPFLTTLHGRLDIPEFKDIYETFPDAPFVSIFGFPAPADPAAQLGAHRAARHARRPADAAAGGAAIRRVPRAHLAGEGRGQGDPHRRRGWAAAEDRSEGGQRRQEGTWNEEIKPLVDASPWVEFIGEINDSQKPEFLSGAHALLFPIDWPEPFGLVMIEAMACGTPVIAFNRGSVPEVIDNGVSGFIVQDEASAIAALKRVDELDRAMVRRTFDRRFTARRMAEDYVDLYEELCEPEVPLLRAVGD